MADPSERIGKYLTVEDISPPSRLTKVWVLNGSDNSPLGQIRWYSAWRQYTFWPNGNLAIVLNATCLDDIAKFTRAKTQAHMEALTANSDSGR